jgi:origin recognition complex subunit 1
MAETPLTPRRSRRHQPSVLASAFAVSTRQDGSDSWNSSPLHSRRALATDLLQTEILPEVDEDDEKSSPSAYFYNSFRRKVEPKPPVRVRGKATGGHAEQNAGEEVYRVGDTVLVASSLIKNGIAVITEMWEVVGDIRHVKVSDDDRTVMDDRRMRCRIHWFLMPSQLAQQRAKREHLQVCILLSPVSSTLSFCIAVE